MHMIRAVYGGNVYDDTSESVYYLLVAVLEYAMHIIYIYIMHNTGWSSSRLWQQQIYSYYSREYCSSKSARTLVVLYIYIYIYIYI